jgi:hypothetical protein
MAEISVVKAFFQAGEMLLAGERKRATEVTRIIVENLEKTKDEKEIARTITVSRDVKKSFSF